MCHCQQYSFQLQKVYVSFDLEESKAPELSVVLTSPTPNPELRHLCRWSDQSSQVVKICPVMCLPGVTTTSNVVIGETNWELLLLNLLKQGSTRTTDEAVMVSCVSVHVESFLCMNA